MLAAPAVVEPVAFAGTTTKKVRKQILSITDEDRFKLSEDFLAEYAGQQPDWDIMAYITYKRTYARPLGDGKFEDWIDTVKRVVEGTFTTQKHHCRAQHLPWSDRKAQRSAQEMFRLMWEFKFLPAGRGLWASGTPYVEKYGSAALLNCAFVTTADLKDDFSRPFIFTMDLSMLGVGVGSDIRGAGTVVIQNPVKSIDEVFVVDDSREGWTALLERALDAYAGKSSLPKEVDYSQVRPAGSKINGFGGTASGPAPLVELYEGVQAILNPLIGQSITATAIVDVMNMIGRCVVAGNVRRSAEIVLGPATDNEFMSLKDPATLNELTRQRSELEFRLSGDDLVTGKLETELQSQVTELTKQIDNHPLRTHRWASNNSVFAEVGMDYTRVAESIITNGEPGLMWLENARSYGRMADAPNKTDVKTMGCNPCQPAAATVLTPEGVRTFADIDVGSTIWSGQRWTKVVNKIATGVKPVHRYITRAGVFEGTDNHRIVQHGEKIEVDAAAAIDLAYATPALPTTLDPKHIIDGLMIGDGTWENKVQSNVLLIGTKDYDYANSEVAPLIKSQLPPGYHKGIAWYVDSSITARLPYTFDRVVPPQYLYGDSRTVRGFLRGLYSANGSIVGGRVTLKASSLRVIEAVQVMLSSIGIATYYTTNKPTVVDFSNGAYECKQSYDLNIGTLQGKQLFRELVGFLQKYKNEKLVEVSTPSDSPFSHKGNTKTTYEIVDVEDMGELPVFDITVDAEEHTYWTGGLLVSNCGEQQLHSEECCNLVETFPARHATYEEYERTLKFAYLYSKTVTLIPTHSRSINAVMMKNRRIGTSQSGIQQSVARHGLRAHMQWSDRGYKYIQQLDETYSNWLCIPRSIRTTTVKPSGTVSILAGATPGIHFEHAEYYYRTIRIANDSPLLTPLRDAGYRLEADLYTPGTTVVYFPTKAKYFSRGKSDVSMWEQLEMAALMQHWWCDNMVSATVTFTKAEAKDIPRALELFETRLKSISFLPASDHGYAQAPYTTITKEEYEQAAAGLRTPQFGATSHEVTEKFCDGDRCSLPMNK